MRTKAFLRPATSCAIALAAIVAAAAIGAPGPAFAKSSCGGVSTHQNTGAQSGVKSGVNSGTTHPSGSTGTTPISSCPSTANTVVAAPHAPVASGSPAGTFTHNGNHNNNHDNKEANIQHTIGAHTWPNKITATNRSHKS
jgi:hypothetical protein